MGGRLSRSAIAFAFALSVGVCRGDEPDSTDAAFAGHADLVTLRAYTLTHNPEIAAMAQRWRAARARPSQEGSLPDPIVNTAYHNESFDRFTQGSSDFSFLRFGAEQEVPFPGKLGLKEAIASREADREGALYRSTVLNVITRLRVAYSDYVLVTRSIAVIEKNKALLETLEQAAEARYRVGDGIQQDVLRAQVELSILIGRLTSLAQARESAAAALNALLNRLPSAPLGAPEPLEPPAITHSLEDFEHLARDRSPTLQAAGFDTARAESGLKLAKRQYYPDFVLRADYFNKADLLPEWEVGVGVRIPLYFWRKQAFGVEEAAATVEETRAARQVTTQDVLARVKDLFAQATAAERLAKLYGSVIIPQADRSLQSASAGYQVGAVDFLTMLNSFTVLNDYQVQDYEQRANLEKAVAGLEDLAGLLPELPPSDSAGGEAGRP